MNILNIDNEWADDHPLHQMTFYTGPVSALALLVPAARIESAALTRRAHQLLLF